MPAPKSLDQHVQDGTFRARRHRHLLAGPVVGRQELASLQVVYVNATSEPERRAVAVEFERTVRGMHEQGEQDDEDAARIAELDAILNAPPALIDLDRIEALAERQERAQQAQWRYRDGEPLAAIAERLGVARSTVRRDLDWWWRTLAPPGQRDDDCATRARRARTTPCSRARESGSGAVQT